jgi:hypothetical protein
MRRSGQDPGGNPERSVSHTNLAIDRLCEKTDSSTYKTEKGSRAQEESDAAIDEIRRSRRSWDDDPGRVRWHHQQRRE